MFWRRAHAALLALPALAGTACTVRSESRAVAAPSAIRRPSPLPSGPVFEGGRPARMELQQRPLGVTPDGTARWLVRAAFVTASGARTTLLGGGHVDFVPSHGRAQWQTRIRYGGPAAIVSTTLEGPLEVAVVPRVGVELGTQRAATDTRRWPGSRIVAQPLGPRLVQLGWFPAPRDGDIRIVRTAPAMQRLVTHVAAPASTYRDSTVVPGTAYRYSVELPGRDASSMRVSVPRSPAHGGIESIRGKAMWLSFSPSSRDPDAYTYMDPPALVTRAKRAGLRAIELRTAYGPYWEVTAEAKPTIDALIDAAAAAGIATIGWTVPRSDDFDDVATAVRTALYRTPHGHGFAALAVDLERGEEYLGDGPAGYAALARYLGIVRAALGPGYPLIATVEDPYLEHLTNATFPFAAIAADADALQPMAYWRMLSRTAVTPDGVRRALRGSYAATRREARRDIPIDVGGQTSAEGPRGAPPPSEIAASIRQAHASGALGITFFDWTGTSDVQWRALARTAW